MPGWVNPRGTCHLCHGRQDIVWRGPQQFQTGVSSPFTDTFTKSWRQMGSAGSVSLSLLDREWDRERVCDHCTTLAEQVTACAGRQEVALKETKRHLPIKRVGTEPDWEKKNTLLFCVN